MEFIESLERMKRADQYCQYRTVLSTQPNSKLWFVVSVEFYAILSKTLTAAEPMDICSSIPSVIFLVCAVQYVLKKDRVCHLI